MTAEN